MDFPISGPYALEQVERYLRDTVVVQQQLADGAGLDRTYMSGLVP